jgi:hypothetical protein
VVRVAAHTETQAGRETQEAPRESCKEDREATTDYTMSKYTVTVDIPPPLDDKYCNASCPLFRTLDRGACCELDLEEKEMKNGWVLPISPGPACPQYVNTPDGRLEAATKKMQANRKVVPKLLGKEMTI